MLFIYPIFMFVSVFAFCEGCNLACALILEEACQSHGWRISMQPTLTPRSICEDVPLIQQSPT